MWRLGGCRPRASITLALSSLIVFSALALAACGGSGTSASTSPSVAPSQAVASPSAAASPSATPLPTPTVDGTIVFARIVRGGDNANDDLYLVNTDGTGLKRLTSGSSCEDSPSWSPDGSGIAYTFWRNANVQSTSIWVMNADGSGKVRLTKGAVHGTGPSWSPDGNQIAFTRQFSSPPRMGICVMNTDGSGLRGVTPVTPAVEAEVGAPAPGGGLGWTADGRIVFLPYGGTDLFVVNPDGSGLMQLTKSGNLRSFAMSPDGKTIAVQNDVSVLQVVPVQGGGTPVTLLDSVYEYMADPYACPSWKPDGKALAIASSSLFGMTGSHLYVINADGSGLSEVPGTVSADDPAWRPR